MIVGGSLLAATLVVPVAAAQTPGGTAVIVGAIVRKDLDVPLGYAVVSVPSLNQQTFTNERGAFSLRNLPVGKLAINVKHIGFASRDTAVTLGNGDTLRMTIALIPLAIQLPAVRVAGNCGDKHADEAVSAVLLDLFDQVQQNADRYRLLADSNPFQMRIHRVHGDRDSDGQIIADAIDTVTRGPFPPRPYEPRHLVNARNDGPGGRRVRYLSVPELADFGDTAFTNNHCFSYAGEHLLTGDTVIAVEFEPAPSLKGEVDFRGSIYVRARDYELLRSDLVLTRVPSDLRGMGMTGMSISTTFHEILPGVPVIWYMESVTGLSRNLPRIEAGQVFEVRWVKGPP